MKRKDVYVMTNVATPTNHYSNPPKPTPYSSGHPTQRATYPPTAGATPTPYGTPNQMIQNVPAGAQVYQGQPTATYSPASPSTAHPSTTSTVQASTPTIPTQGYPNQGQGVYSNPTPPVSNQGQGAEEMTDRDREFEKEDKKLYHKRTRIIKYATNKAYFEVFNFGFKYGRVAIKMSNYKPQYSEVLISLDFGNYFELKDLIMSGMIYQKQADGYGNLHSYNKGTGSKYSKDGTVRARQFAIQPAKDPNKYMVTFIAKEGVGKEDPRNKLIQFAGKPDTQVIYPMTRAMLIEFFNTVDFHIQAYINACYQYQFTQLPQFTKES